MRTNPNSDYYWINILSIRLLLKYNLKPKKGNKEGHDCGLTKRTQQLNVMSRSHIQTLNVICDLRKNLVSDLFQKNELMKTKKHTCYGLFYPEGNAYLLLNWDDSENNFLSVNQLGFLSTVVTSARLLNELLKIHMGQYFRKCNFAYCFTSLHLLSAFVSQSVWLHFCGEE